MIRNVKLRGAAAFAAEQGNLEQVSRRAHMAGGAALNDQWAVPARRLPRSS